MDRLYKNIEHLLGVDIRSLGVFRILLGVIILYDLSVRAFSLEAHYSDSGIISRHILKGLTENPLLLSLNMLSGEVVWQWIVFGIAASAALALLVGFKSRLATIVCLVTLLSIQVRNPFVNNLGDWFLLHLLFWASLLPLGSYWSIDSRTGKVDELGSGYVLSIASLGILVQIASLYFFSVDHKISPIWHSEGTAIQYALSLDRLVTIIGEWVLLLPSELLRMLTFGTLFLERWGPVLIFVPFFVSQLRIILVFCFWMFHLGLALTLELGIFPFVCMTAWILLLPGAFWDGLGAHWARLPSKNDDEKVGVSSRLNEDREASVAFMFNTLFSITLLLLVISSNLLYAGRMSVPYYEGVYKYVEPFVNSLNLRQRWNMFSPHPSKQDGWFIIIGEKENGSLVNLFEDGQRASWERPLDISSKYKNQRWRKNMEWAQTKWDPHSQLLGDYFLRNWNKACTFEQRVVKVSVYIMEEYALGPYDSSPINLKLVSVSRLTSGS